MACLQQQNHMPLERQNLHVSVILESISSKSCESRAADALHKAGA